MHLNPSKAVPFQGMALRVQILQSLNTRGAHGRLKSTYICVSESFFAPERVTFFFLTPLRAHYLFPREDLTFQSQTSLFAPYRPPLCLSAHTSLRAVCRQEWILGTAIRRCASSMRLNPSKALPFQGTALRVQILQSLNTRGAHGQLKSTYICVSESFSCAGTRYK